MEANLKGLLENIRTRVETLQRTPVSEVSHVRNVTAGIADLYHAHLMLSVGTDAGDFLRTQFRLAAVELSARALVWVL